MQAWPSCTYTVIHLEKMRLKWRCPCASWLSRPLRFPAHLLGCIATRTLRNLDFVWFNANRWMRNFPPPPPPPGVTRPFFFSSALLDGPSASEASCFVSETRLQHPCAVRGKEKPVLPPPTEPSRAASSPYCLSITVILRNSYISTPASFRKCNQTQRHAGGRSGRET